MAPGGSQQSSNSGGVLSTDVVSRQLSYSYQQGTSFASPHVAGVVALMYANGITDPHTVREILLDTAEDLGTVGFDRYYGHGLINAYAAVAGITRQDALSVSPKPTVPSSVRCNLNRWAMSASPSSKASHLAIRRCLRGLT